MNKDLITNHKLKMKEQYVSPEVSVLKLSANLSLLETFSMQGKAGDFGFDSLDGSEDWTDVENPGGDFY